MPAMAELRQPATASQATAMQQKATYKPHKGKDSEQH
jgi:hypothetical protein